MSIDAVSDSELDEAATPIAAQRLLRLGHVCQLRMQRSVCCGLAVLLTTLGTANALELGELSVKSALGQPLQVEIAYRLAANERLAADCVSLAQPPNGADGTPTYTLVNRIVVDATRIQVFGSALVREPLLGLNVRVQCAGVPHIVRSYMLFVDPPVRTSAAMLSSTSATSSATAIPMNQQVQSAAAVAPRNSNSLRQVASPRARGQAGIELTQGQTYLVIRGDTLSGIASRISGRPGTIWQTADAVFEANPQAFINADPDRIQAGRPIEIPMLSGSSSPAIPVVTADSVTSPSTESQLPEARFADTATELLAAPLAPSAEPGERADIRDNIAPAFEPAAQAAGPTTEAAAVTAANLVDSTPSLASEEPTIPLSTSIYSLLAFGAGVLLLLWPALIVFRKRSVRADPKLIDDAAETASNSLSTPVVDNGVADRLAAETPVSSSPQLPSDDSAAVSAGLNMGMPLPGEEPADSIDTQRENDPVDASTIMKADVTAEFPRNAESATTINEPSRADRNTQTMTIVELELLQQDYETELTLTQHNSPAMREAIAELKATEAAYAASGKRPTYEGGEGEQADASLSREATESAETVAYRPSKRRSSAKG